MLALFGAAGVGAAAAAGGIELAHGPRATAEREHEPGQVVPFYGGHQAGIATPQPGHLSFAAIDVERASPAQFRDLLQTWTAAAVRMTRGDAAATGLAYGVSKDTGEAMGLPPSRLTVTFGFGPGLFGRELLGLAQWRPPALIDLPAFANDHLDPARSGGDLCIQACADDRQVAFHAVRELIRLGAGVATLRWAQNGFLPRVPGGRSVRNLLGFKDGTNNLRGADTVALAQHVWVGGEGPAWMRGGSYLVARRIRNTIEEWDASDLTEQEHVIGRSKASGAPLGATREHDVVRLERLRTDDKPFIPKDAHIRLASPATNGGARLLRRGYSFDDGVNADGTIDAGLFFLAYQRDSRRQFVPIQERLSRLDALNEYIRHTGSALFAIPPGVRPGGFVGEGLLGL